METMIRQQLVDSLRMKGAHISAREVFNSIKKEQRGHVPRGVGRSMYQLIEHMRICIEDIVNFCKNPDYVAPDWPGDYWPEAAVPSEEEWRSTTEGFFAEMEAMENMVMNPATNLEDKIPHGTGQTYFREALIVIDHNSYHLGQIVSLVKHLGD